VSSYAKIFPPDISRNKVLNTAEAAEFVNFSIPHFRRLYRNGGVPAPIQLSARKLGWKVGDLIDWVATRQQRPVQT
jgi:predicted DNA-binding transcriptional regulator AlpA